MAAVWTQSLSVNGISCTLSRSMRSSSTSLVEADSRGRRQRLLVSTAHRVLLFQLQRDLVASPYSTETSASVSKLTHGYKQLKGPDNNNNN